MAVIAGPGQALGRNGATLGPGGGLQQLEQGEAQCLLDLQVTLELDVGAPPEALEILPLLADQPREARAQRAVQAGIHLVAQPLDRFDRRPVVGEQLDQPQLLARLERYRYRHAPQVSLGLDGGLGRAGSADHVLHARADCQPGAPRAVHHDHAQVVADGQLRRQTRSQAVGRARVRGLVPLRLIGHEVRLERHADGLLERFDLVFDGSQVAVGEGNEALAAHRDGTSRLGPPADLAMQYSGPQIEEPLVCLEVAAMYVEGLVLDQQPDHLAIGHRHDFLAVLGPAVGTFAVLQRV